MLTQNKKLPGLKTLVKERKIQGGGREEKPREEEWRGRKEGRKEQR